MYKTKKDELYYVFSRNNGRIVFKNYYKLLWWAKYKIEEIGNNWNDTFIYYDTYYVCKPTRYLIEYIIADENYRIINIEQIKKDIENLKEEKRNYYQNRTNVKKWEFFRNSPIPYVFKWKGGPGQKNPQVKNILIEYINYPEYNRGKRGRKYFFFCCDKYKDRTDKCWKRNKIKKQWQKGIK